MIKTVKLATYELRRFKGPLPIVALLFLLLVPTLYGALYLWSNWDPYGKLDQVPGAVVNQYVPVEVNGKTVDAGNRLVAELQANTIFDWQFVDEEQAAEGLAQGEYYMVITVPPDFSANLVSGTGDDPQRAVLMLHRDDANGFVVGLLTASVQNQLEAAIDRAAIGAYFETVFANLETVKADVTKAADGATQIATGANAATKGATDLAAGITTAKQGSADLVTGLGDAKAGSTQLVTGLSDAKAGSASLVTGLGTLQTGSDNLVPAAEDVASGAQQLASTAVPVLNALGAAVPAIGQAAVNVQQATDNTATLVNDTMTADIADARTALNALPNTDPAYAGLNEALNQISATNTQLVASTTQASQQATAVNNAFDSLNNAASGDISSASSDITALATGAAQVSTGVQGLNTGISTASSGASTLDSGIGELSTGATTLDTGIGTLQLGAQKLDDGLATLETGSAALVTGITAVDTGATQLASDLTAGAARIPTLAPDQEANAEQVLSSPADVQVTIDNPATVYGRGLAPFFFSIAIWVFGISVFLVMRPISGRALAGRASSPRITIAGWLPVLAMAGLGSLIMFGVVWLGLGLNPVNVGGSIGVVLLAAACFTAIAHLLRTWLGVVGSAITLVLLMVQLTAAGGLYPMETLPAPFRAIHTFIPMTYLVDALRITFTGGPTDHLWRDVAVLFGFTIVAVGLCIYLVHRRRKFKVKDLHPVLV
jgi:putative membrane protein